MPIFDKSSAAADWIEPDDVPRPVISFGTRAVDLIRKETEFHFHRKGQLLLSARGIITCEAEGVLWITPPNNALWVPGNMRHNIVFAGTLETYNVFIEPAVAPNLPVTCCTISVSPLLRELLVRSAQFPYFYEAGGVETHLFTLLLDEISAMQVGDLSLPMPSDPRLRDIVTMLLTDPAGDVSIRMVAERAGMSERTFARVMRRETGMTYGRWRQNLNLILAVKWLATGALVQQVASDLGYESASSFVTMFRKARGLSPARYMQQSHERSGL